MAAFNAEKYIEDSILSVINQTYKNWELIVINDGSTDKTEEIVKKYCLLDDRVFLVNQKNSRQSAARNSGLKISTGDWVGFLDSDDLWTPNKLEIQLNYLTQHKDVSVVFSSGYIFHFDNKENLEIHQNLIGKYSGREIFQYQYLFNHLLVPSVIMRKELTQKTGNQEEDILYPGCEDFDYWLRSARVGAVFLGLEEKLFYYRKHDSNTTILDNHKMRIAHILVLLKNYDLLMDSKNILKKRIASFSVCQLRYFKKNRKLNEMEFIMNKLRNMFPLSFSPLIKFLYMKTGIFGTWWFTLLLSIEKRHLI